MGKGLQLGYKYGIVPPIKTTARIGARVADATVFQPAAWIYSREAVKPVVAATSNAIRGMTNWTLTKAIAPTIATGLSPVIKDPVTGTKSF